MLLSGGLDSAVVLARELEAGRQVTALAVSYGQKRRELYAAVDVAMHYRVGMELVRMGQDAEKVFGATALATGNMGPYVVPNRNMVLLSLATAFALRINATRVVWGAHAGPWWLYLLARLVPPAAVRLLGARLGTVYADSSPRFAHAMRTAVRECDYAGVELVAPLMRWSKTRILREGYRLNVPWNLTYSCYSGQQYHCLVCPACTKRAQAFRAAGQEPVLP